MSKRKRRPGGSGSGSGAGEQAGDTPSSESASNEESSSRSDQTSSGPASTKGSSAGTPKREPRIGRRTTPPEGAAASTPGRSTGSTSPRSGSGSKGAASGNGSGSRPSGLRSAGSRSARPAPAQSRPSTKAQREAPPRRQGGLLAAFRAPSVYPKFGETMAAGARTVLGSPGLVLSIMVVVLALWFGLLAIGLDHVPLYYQNLLALPPLSSFFDLNIVFTVAGSGWGTIAMVVALTVVRSVIFAIFTSLIVERLDAGRASFDGVRRGFRCVPPFAGIFFVQITLIYVAQGLVQVLGASIGGLLFFAALVGGVHFLAFAPIIVVRNATTARSALGTSIRAARLPGSRHVGLVLLYFTVAFLAPSFVPMSSAYTVNPAVVTWAVLLAVSIFHFVIIAALAYRFGVIEDDVPPPAPKRQRTSLFARR